MIIAGNGIYERCADCGNLVKLNKWIFGGLHFCLTDEERSSRKSFCDWHPDDTQATRNEMARRQNEK